MAASLAAAALLLAAGAARADDCGSVGGSINIGAGECDINSAASASGSFTLNETLHFFNEGSMRLASISK
jgi:hypothetical protein